MIQRCSIGTVFTEEQLLQANFLQLLSFSKYVWSWNTFYLFILNDGLWSKWGGMKQDTTSLSTSRVHLCPSVHSQGFLDPSGIDIPVGFNGMMVWQAQVTWRSQYSLMSEKRRRNSKSIHVVSCKGPNRSILIYSVSALNEKILAFSESLNTVAKNYKYWNTQWQSDSVGFFLLLWWPYEGLQLPIKKDPPV